MGFVEILFLGAGLSMDAFAIAICRGLGMKKLNIGHCVVIAVFFGGFQALMPVLGWFFGKQFERYITDYDHWIAFGLLVFIGAKMLYEVIKNGDEKVEKSESLNIKNLFVMAIATSIDALAVGVTFAFLGAPIWLAAVTIGVTTFVISLCGVFVGNRFGSKFKKKAEIAGGVILILIGLKILFEHLGVI